MDGLVEELLRLENAKNTALVSIDATAYDHGVHEQIRLLEASKDATASVTNVDQLKALQQLIRVNTRLLKNLLLTWPLLVLGAGCYTATGQLPAPASARSVSVEA